VRFFCTCISSLTDFFELFLLLCGKGIQIFADPRAEQGVSLSCTVFVNRHKQHPFLSYQNRFVLSTGNGGIDKVTVEHNRMAADNRHNHNVIFGAHRFVDGGGIGKLNVYHILHTVFRDTTVSEIYCDLQLIFVVASDFTDKSDITV